MRRPTSHLAFLLLVLATIGMVMQAGSLPHLHAGDQPGFYNEEHDLTLLAGLAGHVIPVDAAPAIGLAIITALLLLFVPERPALRLSRTGDSRAPPVR